MKITVEHTHTPGAFEEFEQTILNEVDRYLNHHFADLQINLIIMLALSESGILQNIIHMAKSVCVCVLI